MVFFLSTNTEQLLYAISLPGIRAEQNKTYHPNSKQLQPSEEDSQLIKQLKYVMISTLIEKKKNIQNAKSLPGGLLVKNLAANVGDVGLIPRSGRSPEGRTGDPLQCSCMENSMDRGTWQATVHAGCQELDATRHSTVNTTILKLPAHSNIPAFNVITVNYMAF